MHSTFCVLRVLWVHVVLDTYNNRGGILSEPAVHAAKALESYPAEYRRSYLRSFFVCSSASVDSTGLISLGKRMVRARP